MKVSSSNPVRSFHHRLDTITFKAMRCHAMLSHATMRRCHATTHIGHAHAKEDSVIRIRPAIGPVVRVGIRRWLLVVRPS